MTPQNMAKIKELTEAIICSKLICSGDIVKKPLFSNFSNLKGHSSLVSQKGRIKIGEDPLFPPNYQILLKNLQSVWSHLYFIIMLYFKAHVCYGAPCMNPKMTKMHSKVNFGVPNDCVKRTWKCIQKWRSFSIAPILAPF